MNTMVPIQLPSMPRRKGLDVKAFCTLDESHDWHRTSGAGFFGGFNMGSW